MGTSRVAKTTKHPTKNYTPPDQIIRHHIGDRQAQHYEIDTTQPQQKPPPLIAIIWEDAITVGNEWETPKQTHDTKPEPTISIGYLHNKTTTHHTLISTLNTQHIGGGILIPNGCIKKTITLTPQ
jgi:hypothetical protein